MPSSEHPSDWRWDAQALRYEHPHHRSTISIIEPPEEPQRGKPNAAFGFGREAKAQPLDADGVWEGMGL